MDIAGCFAWVGAWKAERRGRAWGEAFPLLMAVGDSSGSGRGCRWKCSCCILQSSVHCNCDCSKCYRSIDMMVQKTGSCHRTHNKQTSGGLKHGCGVGYPSLLVLMMAQSWWPLAIFPHDGACCVATYTVDNMSWPYYPRRTLPQTAALSYSSGVEKDVPPL